MLIQEFEFANFHNYILFTGAANGICRNDQHFWQSILVKFCQLHIKNVRNVFFLRFDGHFSNDSDKLEVLEQLNINLSATTLDCPFRFVTHRKFRL